MKKPILGISSILFATVIWGSAFISQKVAMEHMGPFTFQTARCLLAIIALLIAIFVRDLLNKNGPGFIKGWADKKLWKAGILCGILGDCCRMIIISAVKSKTSTNNSNCSSVAIIRNITFNGTSINGY